MQVSGSATILECICPDPTTKTARKHGILGGTSACCGGLIAGFTGNVLPLATASTYAGFLIGCSSGCCLGGLSYAACSAYRTEGCTIRCRRITETNVACHRHLPVMNQPGSNPMLQGSFRADEDAGSHSYPPIISMQPPPYEERDSRATLTTPADPPPPYQRHDSASDGQEETSSETTV